MKRICLWCVYKSLLDMLYIFFIAPRGWGYQGLIFREDQVLYLVSWGIFLVVIGFYDCFFQKEISQWYFSDYIVLFLMLFVFAPGTCLYGAGVFDIEYGIVYAFFWFEICLVYLLMNFMRGKVHILLPIEWEPYISFIFYSICVIHIVTVGYIFFYYAGGKILWPSALYSHMEQIYEQRAFAAGMQLPVLVPYILGSASIVNSILLLAGLCCRKYLIVGVALVAQWMLFSIDGGKMYFFSMLFCIVLYYTAKYLTKFKVIACSTIIVGIALGLDFFSGNLMGTTYLRRFMFIPALLNYNYYCFFLEQTPHYFGLNGIYGADLPYIIAKVFHNQPAMAANNGVLGDAMANFGLWGVFLWPLMLFAFLQLVDYASRRLEVGIFLGLAFSVMTSIQNSFLSTNLLSGGFVVMLLLLWMFPVRISNHKEI